MKKSHSALKWMAEKRARLAGDVHRLERLTIEIAAQKAQALKDLASIDAAIRIFDERLDPQLIPPIAAAKGRYGSMGLKPCLRNLLKAAAPESISTIDLGLLAAGTLSLEFASHKERARWQRNSVADALKALVNAGEVERLHAPDDFSGEVGRWRWKSDDAPSLDHLKAQADALGVGVQQCDDGHE